MILIRIQTFLKSLFFHVWRGFPKTTRLEILERYRICESCEDFNIKYSQCNICGCAISKQSKFLNKLAWADQECPKSKWLKIIR